MVKSALLLVALAVCVAYTPVLCQNTDDNTVTITIDLGIARALTAIISGISNVLIAMVNNLSGGLQFVFSYAGGFGYNLGLSLYNLGAQIVVELGRNLIGLRNGLYYIIAGTYTGIGNGLTFTGNLLVAVTQAVGLSLASMLGGTGVVLGTSIGTFARTVGALVQALATGGMYSLTGAFRVLENIGSYLGVTISTSITGLNGLWGAFLGGLGGIAVDLGMIVDSEISNLLNIIRVETDKVREVLSTNGQNILIVAG